MGRLPPYLWPPLPAPKEPRPLGSVATLRAVPRRVARLRPPTPAEAAALPRTRPREALVVARRGAPAASAVPSVPAVASGLRGVEEAMVMVGHGGGEAAAAHGRGQLAGDLGVDAVEDGHRGYPGGGHAGRLHVCLVCVFKVQGWHGGA